MTIHPTRARGTPLMIVVAYVLLCAGLSTGWIATSCGHTHQQLAELAIRPARLPESDFPDLQRFRGQLIDGSSDESGHESPAQNGARDRNLKKDWKEVKDTYRLEAFVRAYHHLGIMGHLVQDQAVPAHGFDIQHIVSYPGWTWPTRMAPATRVFGDHFELYAARAEFDPIPADRLAFDNPEEAYDVMLDNTQLAILANERGTPRWRGGRPPAPPEQPTGTSTWLHYWKEGPEHLETVFAPGFDVGTFTFHGSFGENAYPDKPADQRQYPPGWLGDFYTPFMNYRAGEAVEHCAACWEAASKKFPPLIKRASAVRGSIVVRVPNAPPPPGVAGPVRVEFDVLENRVKDLSSLVVRLSGVVIFNEAPSPLDPNPSEDELPWKRHYIVLSELLGDTVTIEAVDADGNAADSVTIAVVSGP